MKIFTDEFEDELKRGKYCRWAASMDKDELLGLFWALGEFEVRTRYAPEDIDAFMELAASLGTPVRSKAGLMMILKYMSGSSIKLSEVKSAVVNSVNEARGYGVKLK